MQCCHFRFICFKLTAECGDEERPHLHAVPGIWRPCGAPCVCQQRQHQLCFGSKTLQLLRPSATARAHARSRSPDNWRGARAGRPPRAAMTVEITLSRLVQIFVPPLPSDWIKPLCCQKQREAGYGLFRLWRVQPQITIKTIIEDHLCFCVMHKPPEGFWGGSPLI